MFSLFVLYARIHSFVCVFVVQISAQESRRKKKEYMDSLERKVEILVSENSEYKKKIVSLEDSNGSLVQQLQKLQKLLGLQATPIVSNRLAVKIIITMKKKNIQWFYRVRNTIDCVFTSGGASLPVRMSVNYYFLQASRVGNSDAYVCWFFLARRRFLSHKRDFFSVRFLSSPLN